MDPISQTVAERLADGVAIPVAQRLNGHRLRLLASVKHGSRELEELEFHALTGAHVRRAPPDWKDTANVFAFAGQLTGLPDSVFDQLRGSDIGDVIRATVATSWPMLDLPVQWEDVWRTEAAELAAKGEGVAPRALPTFPGGCALELETPVPAGERDVLSALVFQELTGKVARALPTDGLPVSRLPWLVGQLTGAPMAALDKLTGRDLNRALALAQLFFLAIRGTSATPG